MVVLSFEGNTDDLLMISDENGYKSTRLVDITHDNAYEEVIDVCIASTDKSGKFEKFNQLMGNKIKVTIEIID